VEPVSRQWIVETVEAIWGFRLQHFQLLDLEKLLGGGVYSVMYPTDYGKSSLIEMAIVLGLLRDSDSRWIVIKINESAASEVSDELARKCQLAAEVCERPDLKPLVSWRNGAPWGHGRGFWVVGADHTGRNLNRSVHCYALGSRDLQGKRGRTLIDDVETQEEAASPAMRLQLQKRLSAVMRTLENRPDALWAIFGTPYHETSIYFDFVTRLRGLGVRYEEIRREPIQADGSPLWEDRLRKMEMHRRIMTRTEFAAAYELRPVSSRRFVAGDLERIKDHNLSVPRNEEDFRRQLSAFLQAQRPEYKDRLQWEREVAARLVGLELYVGWDPATTGDWANVVTAMLGRQTYLLRAQLAVNDVWEQSVRIKQLWESFPSASVIIEKNAQQKAFKDVFEKVCPAAPIFGHGTYANKQDTHPIGLAAFAAEIREGNFHLCWGEEVTAEQEYSDFTLELEQYGPTSHPHILVAAWFTWYWSHQHEIEKPVKKAQDVSGPPGVERYRVLQGSGRTSSFRDEGMRKRSSEAWRRRH
jgi:hypothetical protein